MSKLFITSVLASITNADWTDDFTECNLHRAIGSTCPSDARADAKRFTMIPATKRSNNVAGFALDVTPWATET